MLFTTKAVFRIMLLTAGLRNSEDIRNWETVTNNFEVCHPRCVGSVTENLVYYTYSRTQLYFT